VKADNFNLQDYCARIGYTETLNADLPTLQALMRAQLFSVPFENLDVQAGKLVSLELADIVKKIVYNPRGGYCYEVNSLFAIALDAVGIDYYLVGARPMFYPTRRARTHMVVIAKINGEEYLCDTGFGSFGIRAPLALSAVNQSIQQDDDVFRLACSDGKNFTLQALTKGEWVNQYGFDLYPHELLDFIPANYFNSKSPDAVFVQQFLVVKHDELGRTILSGNRLRRVEKGESTLTELSPEAIFTTLKTEFGLTPESSV